MNDKKEKRFLLLTVADEGDGDLVQRTLTIENEPTVSVDDIEKGRKSP